MHAQWQWPATEKAGLDRISLEIGCGSRRPTCGDDDDAGLGDEQRILRCGLLIRSPSGAS